MKMSSLSFHRMRDEHALGLIAAGFVIFLLLIIPNYYKIAYKNTEPVEYLGNAGKVGYPPADGFVTVNSIEEIMAQEENTYTIEVDVEQLTPLDLYMDLDSREYSRKGFLHYINNSFGGVARFYVLTLDNGEKVVVLLDDLSIDLPQKGTVTLPIGETQLLLGGEFTQDLSAESGIEDLSFFVDMAADWRESDEVKELNGTKGLVGIVLFFALWFVFSKIFSLIGKGKNR